MIRPGTQLPETISRARARLLVRAPFFGSIALGLTWVNSLEIGTMATDGRQLWFNPAWCERQGVEKTMGVIAHEVLHVVNKHHLRRGSRNQDLWNEAADLMINRLLANDGYLLPDDGLYDREGRFAGLPIEMIYARLLEERTQQNNCGNQQQPSEGESPSTGSGNPAQQDDGKLQNQQETPSPQANSDGQATIPDPDAGQTSGHTTAGTGKEDSRSAGRWGEVRDLTSETGKKLSSTERHQAEQDLDVRIRQAAAAAAAARRAGKFPGGLHEMVEAATERIDWRNKFRTIFDGTLRGEVSWARPNRRFIQQGLYLPGWRRTGTGRVAFVLDTSGSISANELAVYTAGVLGILEETSPEQLALIQCDTAVRDVAYLQPGECFDRIEVVGRGGTLFQPAFDWIAASDFAPSVIVYATDLMSSDTPDDPGIPVIWLTPSRSRPVPFGEIVEMSF